VRLLSVAQDSSVHWWNVWVSRIETQFERKRVQLEKDSTSSTSVYTWKSTPNGVLPIVASTLLLLSCGWKLAENPCVHTHAHEIFMYNQFVFLFGLLFFFWQYLFKNLWSLCSGKSGLGIYLINPRPPRKSEKQGQISPFFSVWQQNCPLSVLWVRHDFKWFLFLCGVSARFFFVTCSNSHAHIHTSKEKKCWTMLNFWTFLSLSKMILIIKEA